jgi:hypothetical protein
LVIGVLAVCAWGLWKSIQSLLQARLLAGARGGSEQRLLEEGAAAVHGPVTIEGVVAQNDVGEVLWYRWVSQQYVRHGRHGRWRTVGEEEAVAGIVLDVGEQRVRITDLPTEVQSARRRVRYGDGALFSRIISSERDVLKWLPVSEQATAVGKLCRTGDDMELTRSGAVGLLLSPHAPLAAASREAAKGIAGSAVSVAVAVVALSLAMYYQYGPSGPLGRLGHGIVEVFHGFFGA